MPVCEFCHKKIDCLKEVRSGTEKCEVYYDEGNKSIEWENEEFSGDGEVTLYYCPLCDKELDFTEEEAHQFLKDKDELKELVADKLNKKKMPVEETEKSFY
jgi:hypothetical protein